PEGGLSFLDLSAAGAAVSMKELIRSLRAVSPSRGPYFTRGGIALDDVQGRPRPRFEGVADLLEVLQVRGGPGGFQRQLRVALGVHPWRLYGFFQRPALAESILQDVKHRVGDLAAAGRPQREHRPAVAADDGRTHVVQGPLARP